MQGDGIPGSLLCIGYTQFSLTAVAAIESARAPEMQQVRTG